MNNKEDMVNHPIHYNKKGFEAIDIIEAYELDFKLGNAIKYILRAKFKDNYLEDLKKAKWYLDRSIQKLEEVKKINGQKE